MEMETNLTTEIKGRKVLAKDTKYGVMPKTFANRAGAIKAAEKVGGDVYRWGRPFFVVVK